MRPLFVAALLALTGACQHAPAVAVPAASTGATPTLVSLPGAPWKSGEVLEVSASCRGTTDGPRAGVGQQVVLQKVFSAQTAGALVRTPAGWKVSP